VCVCIRLLVFACLACLADAVMRTTACDRPSKLSQMYSGNFPGGAPIKPFGFDVGYYGCANAPQTLTFREFQFVC
jgi:hypothetical protein